MSAPQQSEVNLQDLSIEQLQQVRGQLEDELKHLTTAFGNLKQAQAKFTACMDAIDSIKPANKDKRILIPLTSSLYVPGKLKDTENVMVDVGTGYYVEKSTKAAKTLYNLKILTLKGSLSQLKETIERKNDNLRALLEVTQRKMTQQDRAAAQAASS